MVSVTLIVMMVSAYVSAYVQTHQTAYIKYVHLFAYQLHLNKAV